MQDEKKRLQIRDESLTPDEAHKIEVKVDKMMRVESPDAPAAADSESDKKPKKSTKIAVSAPELPVESKPEEPAKEEVKEPEPETKEIPIEPEPAAADGKDEIAELAAEQAASEGEPPAKDEPASNADSLEAHERDAEIAKQDAELAAAFSKPEEPKGAKFKKVLKALWHNKKVRTGSIIGLVILILIALVLPASRSWALNLVGVRASANIIVLDNTTQLPLQNVQVSVGGANTKTDGQGSASLKGVKLGSQKLHIHKVAFANMDKDVSIGLGSNKLGSIALKAVGTQYKMQIVDYATGQPVSTAKAASGEATALADSKGKIILTASDVNGDHLAISITADNYRSETVNVPIGTSDVTTVQLVSSRHDVFVSKQSGNYDVYKIDLDGKNKQVVLKGTGKETDLITLVPHPTAEEVALVDTRDGSRDSGGYLLQTLTLINVSTGAPTAVDHSEKIQVIDWIGDRVVYVMAKAGASAANPSRYQLMSYDFRTNQRLELDHANSFNDIVSANGAIYYATSNGYNGGVSQFLKINADGGSKQQLLNSEVWNIFRKDYADFVLGSGDSNYTYKIGDAKPAATKDSYDGSNNRLYIDSPDGKHSLWVDSRDGKGTLLSFDTKSQQNTILAQTDGITYPVRWINNDTVIYRVKSNKETADYVIGLGSNSPKKITDVTDAAGRSLWYFY